MLFVAVIKYHDPKKLKAKRVYFGLQFQSVGVHMV